jgi:uncharacterized membrane protein YgaE (UPF0421/DUF939 family)
VFRALWKRIDPSNTLPLLYLARVLVAAPVTLLVARLIHFHAVTWAVVSAVLVLQPDPHGAQKAALLRIAGNAVGAAAGFTCLSLWNSQLTVVPALATTLIVCAVLRLSAGQRSACAATAIVVLAHGTTFWITPLERIEAVMLGSAIAVAITFVPAPRALR